MDDVTRSATSMKGTRPRLDFQDHLADLEARGLLVRIDHPVNKDTELHPLVRLQFIGGIPEAERRAFLFTNVTDSAGRRYDIPVAVGAIAASAEIYALGMGCEVGEIGPAWLDAINHPVAPVRAAAAPCQEVVISGEALRAPDGGLKRLPVPVSTPGFDSAPYLTATLCVTRIRTAASRTWHLPGGAEGDRPAGGAHGGAHRRSRRLRALAQAQRAQDRDADCDRDRCGAGGDVHRPAEARDRSRRDGGGRRARRRADPHDEVQDHRSRRAGGRRDRHRGLIDASVLEPEAPFGESNGYVALEAYNMPMRVTAITHKKNPVFCSIISQVTPSESSLVKRVAYEPLWLAHLRDHLGVHGVRRVVMHEPLTNLRPVIFVQYAAGTARNRGVARSAGRLHLDAELRQNLHRGERGHRPGEQRRDLLVARLSLQPDRGRARGAVSRRRAGLAISRARAATSTLLIDATAKGPMPPLALPKKEFMERAEALWAELKLPPISLKPPWHGYTLGDWIERWDVWAARAVNGTWEETGKETLARQRGGVKPESSARKVEE